MRVFTPEIIWHNNLPALALDISTPEGGGKHRIATGGNDCRVYIWLIELSTKLSTNDNTRQANGNNNNNQNTQLGNSRAPKLNGFPDIKIRAGLRRHQKPVGAVKFSPHSHILASGDDDGYIYIWHLKEEDENPTTTCYNHSTPAHLQPIQPQMEQNFFMNEDGFEDLEVWKQHRVLRGHVEDICDLAWSKDGQYLLSGSVDNSAILWDPDKGSKLWCSDLIKGYVQGVAMDPHAQFMATISSDRTFRVYNSQDKRLLHATRRMNIKSRFKAFFWDDTVQTFCRRFEFSSDGQFLIAPTCRMVEKPEPHQQQQVDSVTSTPPKATSTIATTTSVTTTDATPDQNNSVASVESATIDQQQQQHQEQQQQQQQQTKKPGKPFNVFLVFKRTSFNKPVHYYPTGREPALCVKFSPIIYELRDDQQENFWDIPYRTIFAVATSRSVLIYDSQQPSPIGYASQIHLARLTDLAWSSDGRMLMVTSYDGYVTIITFDKEEFGKIYTGPLLEPMAKVSEDPQAIGEVSINESGEEIVTTTKAQKRAKNPKETTVSKKEKVELNLFDLFKITSSKPQ